MCAEAQTLPCCTPTAEGRRQWGFGIPTDLYLWWGDSTVPKSSGSFEIIVLDVQTWWESCKHSGSLLVESLPCWMLWCMFFSCAKMSVKSAVWWREVSICRWLGIGWNFARILLWGCLWSLIYTTIFPRLLRRHVHGQGLFFCWGCYIDKCMAKEKAIDEMIVMTNVWMETEEEGVCIYDWHLKFVFSQFNMFKWFVKSVVYNCYVFMHGKCLAPKPFNFTHNFARVKHRTRVSGPMRKWLKTKVEKGGNYVSYNPSSSGPLDPMSKWHNGQCSLEIGYRFVISFKGPDQNWRVSSSLDICAIPSYYSIFVPTTYL